MSAWRSARLAAYMPYFAQIWPRTLCAMCEGACWPLRLSHAAIRSTLRNGVGNDNVSTLPRVAVRHLIRPQSLSLREHENSRSEERRVGKEWKSRGGQDNRKEDIK